MKKTLLTFAALFASTLSILAQSGNPLATFKINQTGGEFTMTLASTEAATSYSVDFGDGNLVTAATTQAYDGWDGSVEISGTPAAGSTVKIYSTGKITYLQAFGKTTASRIETADVTKLVDLTDLDLHNNQLATIDLSQNTKLKKLDLNNNSFTSINLAANTALTTLDLSANAGLSSIDLTANTALTKLTLSK